MNTEIGISSDYDNVYEHMPEYTSINSDRVNKEVFKTYGGIALTVLICLSTIIFLILFYDSLCLERKSIKPV